MKVEDVFTASNIKFISSIRWNSSRTYMTRRYLKYRSIVARAQELGSEIVFKIIETNVKDTQDRHIIEALYAYQNRAEFWSPSPLQNIQKLLNNRNL